MYLKYSSQVSTARSLPSARVAAQRLKSRFRYAKLVVIGLALLIGCISLGVRQHASAIEAQAADKAAAAAFARQEEDQRQTRTFKAAFNDIAKDYPEIDLSVAIVSPTGGRVSAGSAHTYDAASTGKLISAITLMKMVESGEITLATQIQGRSAAHWLQHMIVESDDQSWKVLNAYLTHDRLQKTAKSIGMQSYNADKNYLTATDIATLLQKLQSGTLVNANHQRILFAQMQDANYRQFIVNAAPENVTVYHKVGFSGDNLHDAAILKSGQKNMTLVVFSNGGGTYDWDRRSEAFGKITQAALHAFVGQ